MSLPCASEAVYYLDGGAQPPWRVDPRVNLMDLPRPSQGRGERTDRMLREGERSAPVQCKLSISAPVRVTV
jgi:hypothetical protein